MPSRTAFVTIVRGLAVCVFMLLRGTISPAQNYPEGILQITSPADGTVVHPGQTITITVAPASGASFVMVRIVAENPITSSQLLTAPPYQFSITIPKNISARKYHIQAEGAISRGNVANSPSITLDVEPGAPITSLRVQPSAIIAEFAGEQLRLAVWGDFSNGSTMDITNASGTTYSGGNPSVATVSSNGLVTVANPVVPGHVAVVVQYGGKQVAVQVSTARLANLPKGANVPVRPPSLTISSPADGTVVHPGQTLTVSVTSPAGLTFSQVDVIGEYPIGMSAVATSPGQFTVAIPATIPCGPQVLTAEGTTVSGQNVESVSIMIDVERPDLPLLLNTSSSPNSPSTLDLETQGETFRLQLFGTYLGGAILDVTHSSYLTYSSTNTAVATVDATGNVTAVAAGDGFITATYTLASQVYPLYIPVHVEQPRLTTSPTSLTFSSQSMGTRSSPQQVTLTNVIAYPINVLSVMANSDFSETDNCLASPLAPNASCTVNVTFIPTGTGSRTGSLSIADSANMIPIAVSLTGTGTPAPPPPAIRRRAVGP